MKTFTRKAVSLAAAFTMAMGVTPASAGAEREVLGYMGDVNHDMNVNLADVVTLANHLVGNQSLETDSFFNADLDSDGRVDAFDLTLLRQYVMGIRPVEPIYGEEIETTTTTTTTVTTTTTTQETTTTTASADFITPPAKDVKAFLPSQNNANLVIFYVDFPDCKYDYAPTESQIEEIAFGPEDTTDKNYPFDSMSAFYGRSSKGAMDLQGKVFRYTTKNDQSYYNENKFLITKECYEAFNDSVDFSQFDGDGDGYIDATLFTVPTKAGDDHWWPCAGPVDQDSYYIDGKRVGHIITGNAQIESLSDYKNFNSTYLHEMGHCMGLPDYYLFTSSDSEGMHGTAGLELMDTDASSDFGAVSKLQLGWYTESQIQIYDSNAGTQTFKLSNAQKDGSNCVIIPYGDLNNYHSEYFIIEYTTTDGNNSSPNWWVKSGNGIRVYHADTTLKNYGWWTGYRYASGAEDTNKDTGRRYLRVIDDTETDNLYRTGSVIDGNISGFHWYDQNGGQTVDTGLQITVGELTGDEYTITISKK